MSPAHSDEVEQVSELLIIVECFHRWHDAFGIDFTFAEWAVDAFHDNGSKVFFAFDAFVFGEYGSHEFVAMQESFCAIAVAICTEAHVDFVAFGEVSGMVGDLVAVFLNALEPRVVAMLGEHGLALLVHCAVGAGAEAGVELVDDGG